MHRPVYDSSHTRLHGGLLITNEPFHYTTIISRQETKERKREEAGFLPSRLWENIPKQKKLLHPHTTAAARELVNGLAPKDKRLNVAAYEFHQNRRGNRLARSS